MRKLLESVKLGDVQPARVPKPAARKKDVPAEKTAAVSDEVAPVKRRRRKKKRRATDE